MIPTVPGEILLADYYHVYRLAIDDNINIDTRIVTRCLTSRYQFTTPAANKKKGGEGE